MKLRHAPYSIFVAAVLLAATALGAAGAVQIQRRPSKVPPLPPRAAALMRTELAAIASRNFASFKKNGSPRFAAVSSDQFHALCVSLSPALKAGYSAVYVGRWSFMEDDVCEWTLSFKAGPKAYLLMAFSPRWTVDGLFLRSADARDMPPN